LRGTQPASIDEVTNQISAIATDVKAITESLRSVMTGPEGQQKLQEIVENFRQITTQVRELVAANRTNVDATLANTREITAQLRSGEGTVGKLLYSEEAHQRLTTALTAVESGVNELRTTLGRVNRLGLDLGMKAEYQGGSNFNQGEVGNPVGGHTRAAVMLRLIPNAERNRFYNLALADAPRGRRLDKTDQFVITDPNTGRSQTIVINETRFERGFRVSAQAGWNLQPLSVRIGLFDSTGGGGVDYQYNNRLRFTGEAFDFSKRYDPNPHLRLYGEYIFRHEKPNA